MKGQHVEVKGKSFKQLLTEKNKAQSERKELYEIVEKQIVLFQVSDTVHCVQRQLTH